MNLPPQQPKIELLFKERKVDSMKKNTLEDERFLNAFGQIICARRNSLQMTQQELGERIGSQSTRDVRSYVSKLEHGKVNPTITTIFRIAKALYMLPVDLIADAEKAAKPDPTIYSLHDSHQKLDMVAEKPADYSTKR